MQYAEIAKLVLGIVLEIVQQKRNSGGELKLDEVDGLLDRVFSRVDKIHALIKDKD